MVLEQVQEVVRLEQHVGELREGKPLLVLETSLHELRADQIVDGEVLPDVTQELEQRLGTEPIDVVEHQRPVGAFEIKEAPELGADPNDVLGNPLHGLELAFLRLAAGIAHHPGAPADERDRAVAVALHASERHDREQRADVQARRGGVESDVARDPFLAQNLGEIRGRVGHEAAPLEVFVEGHPCGHRGRGWHTLLRPRVHQPTKGRRQCDPRGREPARLHGSR